MKTQFLLSAILIIALFTSRVSIAQQPYKYCGTQEIHNEYVKNHPEILELDRLRLRSPLPAAPP